MTLTDQTREDLITMRAELLHRMSGATNDEAIDFLADEIAAVENELYERAEAAADAAADAAVVATARILASVAAWTSPPCAQHTPAR